MLDVKPNIRWVWVGFPVFALMKLYKLSCGGGGSEWRLETLSIFKVSATPELVESDTEDEEEEEEEEEDEEIDDDAGDESEVSPLKSYSV